MRKILVQGQTDRGTSFRQSTRNADMPLEVYYLDGSKKIRKVTLQINLTTGENVSFTCNGQNMRATGEPAEKLSANV